MHEPWSALVALFSSHDGNNEARARSGVLVRHRPLELRSYASSRPLPLARSPDCPGILVAIYIGAAVRAAILNLRTRPFPETFVHALAAMHIGNVTIPKFLSHNRFG